MSELGGFFRGLRSMDCDTWSSKYTLGIRSTDLCWWIYFFEAMSINIMSNQIKSKKSIHLPPQKWFPITVSSEPTPQQKRSPNKPADVVPRSSSSDQFKHDSFESVTWTFRFNGWRYWLCIYIYTHSFKDIDIQKYTDMICRYKDRQIHSYI